MTHSNAKLYSITIFMGAFLLFEIQPLISKMILHWFGGSPMVWTTCMMFFQITLLLGYAYAHLLSNCVCVKWQKVIHIILLFVALYFSLDVQPAAALKPEGAGNPLFQILCILLSHVGLPYFVLATTGPLVQMWNSYDPDIKFPYRLYALSNSASLIALVVYPFMVEPNLKLSQQGVFWSAGFVLFTLFYVLSCWRFKKTKKLPEDVDDVPLVPKKNQYVQWIFFPALAVAALLAVTNHVCQDVAVIPFLWIIPLILYLLTFIICFEKSNSYKPFLISILLLCLLCGLVLMQYVIDLEYYYAVEACFYFLILFFICLICHGELFRSKPARQYLTLFYLQLSFGGALGGCLVTVLCPLLFNDYYEINIILMLSYVLAAVVFVGCGGCQRNMKLIFSTLGFFLLAQAQIPDFSKNYLKSQRNFFGVLKVTETNDISAENNMREFEHGRVLHGLQFLSPERKNIATSYYGQKSGVGLTIKYFSKKTSLKVGMVGLGVGTLASYGREGDVFKFYEINPIVEEISREYFSFIKDSPAAIAVVLGDARLSLEKESDQQYDILVLDAFSGDAIPVHLLTKEAFAEYLRHLKQEGVIAINISNRHLDLSTVVANLATHNGLGIRYIENEDDNSVGVKNSMWMLLSRNKLFLDDPIILEHASEKEYGQLRLWTDDYSNLMAVLDLW